jgi:hypothetical protein
MNRVFFAFAAVLVSLSGSPSAHAQLVSADLLLKGGDSVGSSTVDSLNAPFVNGLGQVGFLTALSDGSRSVVIDGVEVFNYADALPDVLSGGESTMGIGDNGEFIISPGFNGEDAVFGQNGFILVENTQAPGFDSGVNSTFHSRPQMSNDGTAYWISGFSDGVGGTSTVGRMIYRRTPDGTFDVLLKSGDTIGTETVDDGGAISFDYSISENRVHSMFEFDAAGIAGSSNSRLLVDGIVVAAEGSSTGQGDNWDNFDKFSINNSGNFIFSGDTDGSTTIDEFIAFNGIIQLREGDSLDGGILDGLVDDVAVNEANSVSFIFDHDTGDGAVESLFFAEDGFALGDAFVLARVGDELDVDGDGSADWTLDDFNAGTGPGIALSEDGLVYVEVDLLSLDGNTNVEAIVGFRGTSAIPEPSSAFMLFAGASLMLIQRRRRQ